MFEMRGSVKIGIFLSVIGIFFWRGIGAVIELSAGAEAALLAFPLTAIFPTLLIFILLLMGATNTREGLLMRVGTLIHLLLILTLPKFALYLALGFPFVFLTVEIYETRLPQKLTAPLTRLVVR